MGNSLSKLKDKYAEIFAEWIPLSVASVYLVALLSLYSTANIPDDGIFFSITELTLAQVFSAEAGLIWELSLFQLLAALGMSMVALKTHALLKEHFFSLLMQIKSTDQYIGKLREIHHESQKISQERIKEQSGSLKNIVDKRHAELRRRDGVSQVLLGVTMTTIFLFRHSSTFDLMIAFTCFSGTLALQWNIYTFYLSKYLPALITHTPSANFGDGLFEE